MDAELYIVPVGVVEQQIVSSVEIYIPELNMIISPGNSTLVNQEEVTQRYEELEKIADLEIPDDETDVYKELQASVALHMQCEEKALSQLDPIITDAVQKFQAEPHIHIPTIDETSEILGKSNIIIEG